MKLRKTNSARGWTSSKRALMTWRDSANDGPKREIILTTSFFSKLLQYQLDMIVLLEERVRILEKPQKP